jgi:hypothetical protein
VPLDEFLSLVFFGLTINGYAQYLRIVIGVGEMKIHIGGCFLVADMAIGCPDHHHRPFTLASETLNGTWLAIEVLQDSSLDFGYRQRVDEYRRQNRHE